MSVLRIGLVVEGKTDGIVTKALLTHYFAVVQPDIRPEFIDLQPDHDGTSGSPEGGWMQVLGWCLRHPPDDRRASYFGRGLFANGMNAKLCDLLIVMLDADASAEIAAKSPLAPPPPPPNATLRGAFIRGTLDAWLWPGPTDTPDTRHVTAAAVESIETWLISAFDDDDDPENILNVPARFAAAFYRQMKKAPQIGVRKSTANYQPISEHAREHVLKVHAKCLQFQYIITAISPIAHEIS